MTFIVPERYRLTTGPMASDSLYGNNGAFLIPILQGGKLIAVQLIAADGAGWEHVSVRTEGAPPDWALMCLVKDLFWGPDDCVVQYHPKASDYVNNHPNVLHLWREVDREFPKPPTWLVGALSPQSHAVPAEPAEEN